MYSTAANDNDLVFPEFAALAGLSDGELYTLAFMVDRRDQGVHFEVAERRYAVRLYGEGDFAFEAPRAPWEAAIDLRILLRCGAAADAVSATGLSRRAVDAFARGLTR